MPIVGNQLKLSYGVIEDANVVKYLTGRENPIVLLDNAVADVIARKQDWFRFVWMLGDLIKVYESEKGWHTINVPDAYTSNNVNKLLQPLDVFIVHSDANGVCDESAEDFINAVKSGASIKVIKYWRNYAYNQEFLNTFLCDHTSYDIGLNGPPSAQADGGYPEVEVNEIVFYHYGVKISNGSLVFWEHSSAIPRE